MPTANRLPFVRQALRCFAAQTYPDKELIVVDDSERSVGHLCRDVPGVRHIRLLHYTPTGAKLNIGIEAARGQVIQKLDDDDYYGPEYLATQMANSRRGALVTRCCFLILLKGDTCVRHSGHGWHPGGTFCFTRAMWKKHPFREIRSSEDSWFVVDQDPRIIRICGYPEDYMVVRHGQNTWNAMTDGSADAFFRRQASYSKPLMELVPAGHLRFYRRYLKGGSL